MTRLPVNLICTDRGQHRRRDLAFMTEVGADYPMKRDPVFNGVTARWHVGPQTGNWPGGRVVVSQRPLAEVRERITVFSLEDFDRYGGEPGHWNRSDDVGEERRRAAEQKLIDAQVLVFACPSCRRRPRWRRDNLDKLCDAVSPEVTVADMVDWRIGDYSSVDLSQVE
jgi:hypothetical protein